MITFKEGNTVRKAKILITVLVLIALGVGGFFVWKNILAPKGFEWFQTGNTQEITKLQPKRSQELEDNRIGQMASLEADVHTEEDVEGFVFQNTDLGMKWIRLSIDHFSWPEVESTGIYSEYYVEPNHDRAITSLVNNDIKIRYTIVYWDGELQGELGEEYTRYKTEEEIERYLNYTRFIVRNFKNRIEYYELLNEPNHHNEGQQSVKLADYINLVRRTVPVIRNEYPEAKIVVSGGYYLRGLENQEFLFGILRSDIMPLVDVVAWHPMYGTSPEYDKEYYDDYPSLIQEIKDTASAHGFKGEYLADELIWRTPVNPHPDEYSEYSKTAVAKYYARGIVMHLGMDLNTGLALESLDELPLMVGAIRNLATIMAGAEPTNLPIEIQSEATNIKSYTFSLSNGDKLITLWTDGVAVDDDPGVKAKLTIPSFSAEKVTGIDVLNGYQQSIATSNESGNLVIQNLIVRDYPLILRIAKPSQ